MMDSRLVEAEAVLAGRRAVEAHRESMGLVTTKWTGVGRGMGFKVPVEEASQSKRARKAAGVHGRKAAKRFARQFKKGAT
jgi:hypothetical protein